MIRGCIGERLSHSFSEEIHRLLGDASYELKEVAPEELAAFLREEPFQGVNVTIPYKQAVIPYLDEISETVRAVGAVNTVVRRQGRLLGFNTDVCGLTHLLSRAGLEIKGRKVLVLGTGGTSRTAVYTAQTLGAAAVLRVSRSGRDGALTYPEAVEAHRDAEIIINTTPCGMFPHLEESPLSLQPFSHLLGVADAVYNPLRSSLVLEARERSVPALGGLDMLAAQAVRAAELFRDEAFPSDTADRICADMLKAKENIVLIGMPGSGKSSVAAALGRRLGRTAVDTDQLIARQTGMSAAEIIRKQGEEAFRALESDVIRALAPRHGLVIATGGGAVLQPENVRALRHNGRLVWLDKPLAALTADDDHPLSDTEEKLARLYAERTPIYRAAADAVISVRENAEQTARAVESGEQA